MRIVFKKIVAFILQTEARLILRKYKPDVIMVTGSVGKTSAKDAIFEVVKKIAPARKSQKSFNSEIGFPLTLLGRDNAWYSVFGWLSNLLYGLKLVIFTQDYPKIIVAEIGVQSPGDIRKVADYLKAKMAVVTAIGEIPVHVEYFAGPEDIAREKSEILRTLEVDGWAILNFDDAVVFDMKEKTKAHVMTYGFSKWANVRASNYKIFFTKKNKMKVPEGITFKVDYNGTIVPIRIYNSFGKHHVYSALAAICAGLANKMNLVEIAEALGGYSSPPGRLKLIEGEKNTWILDDTYNASPQSMHAALHVLQDLPAKRKIAVLGDMLELGRYTIEAHRAVARSVKFADILITVGMRAKFIAEEARALGFPGHNIAEFFTSIEAAQHVEKILQPEDLLLIKGSQGMRMERVVVEIMSEPQRAKELIVRQDDGWLSIL
ncbi:MAG: hypothetical protein COU46_00045 [Candidatus Niyogibacteria bacterium CG10_big_fil_rev_8_21_14_0_10_42_19]|uniref:UDP-N-acetylmuramoyl-tripeptide--D-alanyl-D-alanine ligase n=1 Tax=Candidatus Niyogibacteria bacterium CG10_big_fil_rev_8_21_14_0_10_42_19 TaxID=1974725 RepID=A0A2H0TGI8_9BACT|nr:MAG: hypothetical protein COU46_00045 [Candidatus Niyogibacteria bacterium CG10_big_fil_rev_8_21_14_0_10_42_19]